MDNMGRKIAFLTSECCLNLVFASYYCTTKQLFQCVSNKWITLTILDRIIIRYRHSNISAVETEVRKTLST